MLAKTPRLNSAIVMTITYFLNENHAEMLGACVRSIAMRGSSYDEVLEKTIPTQRKSWGFDVALGVFWNSRIGGSGMRFLASP